VEAGSTLAMALILACSIAAILITVSQIRPSHDLGFVFVQSGNDCRNSGQPPRTHLRPHVTVAGSAAVVFSAPWSQTRGTKMEVQADIVLLVLIF
jgi:hypothetical protein